MRARGVRSRIHQSRHRRCSAVICCGGGARREWPAGRPAHDAALLLHYAPWQITRRVLAAAPPFAPFTRGLTRFSSLCRPRLTTWTTRRRWKTTEPSCAPRWRSASARRRVSGVHALHISGQEVCSAFVRVDASLCFWLCAGPRLCGRRRRGPRVRRRLRVAGGLRRSRPRTLCVSQRKRCIPRIPSLTRALVRSGRGLDRHRARHPRGGCGGRRARGVR